MIKYCDNVNCTHRLCPAHVYNKNENLDYEIADLVHSNICRLSTKPKPKKRKRDKELAKLKSDCPDRVWGNKYSI